MDLIYRGCVCKLVRTLYGLKSSGAAWRAMFAEFVVIDVLGFIPTRADADVYIQRNFCNGGTPYYEYLLVYFDDILVVSHAPTEVMLMAHQHPTWVPEYRKYSLVMASNVGPWIVKSMYKLRLKLYGDSLPKTAGNSKHRSQNTTDRCQSIMHQN